MRLFSPHQILSLILLPRASMAEWDSPLSTLPKSTAATSEDAPWNLCISATKRQPITIKRGDPLMHMEFLKREGEPSPYNGNYMFQFMSEEEISAMSTS